MGLRYNPFNGSFDFTRSPGSYLDGEVATFADLPLDTAAAPLNSAWLVREASGLWLVNRKPAGIYIRTATGGTDRNADYTYASAFPDVFSDANFTLYDDADSTKNAKFSLGGITAGTTRTLTVPDASGTLPLLESANTFTQNQTLNGTNNVAPNQSASSDSSLMTRALGDARYFLNNAILTDFYDIPLANSNGANSGLNAFSIASNQGFTSTFTGGAAPAANSYAVWSNNYSGATQSSSSVFCGAGFGLTAIIQSPARDDCFTRLIVGGLSANTDRTLGTLTAKGFGIETDRSLAGTGNTAFRMRLIYNDGTTTHVGSWSLNQSSAKFRVWFINTGTQIIGYFVGIGTNVLPPKTFTALPFINTTVGDNFLTSSSLHQTFQVVTAGGTAASIYAEIQRVKQTYNFFPA
jgi:hypothetical protein